MTDVNDPRTPAACVGVLDTIIDARGERLSTDRAFLPAALTHERQARLKICTNTIATGVALSSLDQGLCADGVYFEAANTRQATYRYFAKARREVVLCAGALGSPQILMLRYVMNSIPMTCSYGYSLAVSVQRNISRRSASRLFAICPQ